jgi:transcriptional regulator with GAF, ATPase, and Fis domain
MDITERRHAENELRRSLAECQEATAALEMAYAEIKTLKDRLYKENPALNEEFDLVSASEEIVGISRALKQVLALAARVAPTDSTILITGATGTGKELLARAIHKRSCRSGQAFVAVNCAAVPPSLIGSELFGHEKGAFTGAIHRHLGRFELADGGTILLDEVGELPPETQLALLRVLQEREFERLGGSRSIPVDVRVLAATSRDLKAAIASGNFRADLFYRLNVFPIKMPSLRERIEDIPLLVEHFVKRNAAKAGKKVTHIETAALELLQSYDWPGNIRELQNVVERAMILCGGERFSVDETWVQPQVRRPPSGSVHLITTIVEQERSLIETALIATVGRVSGPSGAAAKLGIPRSTLESKIRRLEINKYQFKRPLESVAEIGCG